MSKTFEKQVKTYGPRRLKSGAVITAEARYDDECHNGHNTFAITGAIYSRERIPGEETIQFNGKTYWCCGGGCCHEEIAEAFPELAGVIKWHLCGSDGPMHYVANVVYMAGDRDCWGLRKGEFRQFRSHGPHQNWGVEGVPNWTLAFPKELARDVYAAEKPAPVVLEWQPYGKTGEGKARELDAARQAAIWPEATDEQLSTPADQLAAALEARLPALLAEFRTAVESLGFEWEPNS